MRIFYFPLGTRCAYIHDTRAPGAIGSWGALVLRPRIGTVDRMRPASARQRLGLRPVCVPRTGRRRSGAQSSLSMPGCADTQAKAVTSQTPSPQSKTWRRFVRFMESGHLQFLDVNRGHERLVAGTARCAVRAAFSGAMVPPAATRAGTSQRDVPTSHRFMGREHLHFFDVS